MMEERQVRTGAWTRLVKWIGDHSPVVTRRTHEARLDELRAATGELIGSVRALGDATQEATSVLTRNARHWQTAAMIYQQERDEARQEIDRLRATIASLVVTAVSRGPTDPC